MNDISNHEPNETSKESNLVCFDGTSLEILQQLRDSFRAFNLTVIENSPAINTCLYQIICVKPEEVSMFNARMLRNCKRRLLLTQNISLDDARILSKTFDAKVAIISNSILTKDDARVVFGFLFSENNEPININTNTNRNHSNKQISQVKKSSNTSWKQKEKDIETLIMKHYFSQRKKKSNIFLSVLQTMTVVVFLFVSIHVTSVVLSFVLLSGLLKAEQNKTISTALLSVNIASTTGSIVGVPLELLPYFDSYKRVLSVIKRTRQILYVAIEQKDSFGLIAAFAQIGDSQIVAINKMTTTWKSITPEIALILSDIKVLSEKTSFPWSTNILQEPLRNATHRLSSLLDAGNVLSSIANIYPMITGGSEGKTYLLLLQNNRELRPSGGFIGTVGLLRFSNNQLGSFSIEDVYSIDGQLKGHVDPPLPIRTILNQEHWYLRDSNWSPDFTESANKAAWFYQKSMGEDVDGVIALSLPFVEKLLQIIGPVDLPDYNTTLDDQSVFNFLHTTIHGDFFAGSQQKKNIITNLSYVLKNKLSNLTPSQYLQIGSLLSTSLSNRTIQLYATNQSLQYEIVSRGWGGQFPPQASCTVQNKTSCLEDLFAVVEANLSVNKVNSAIDRSFSRNSILDESEFFRTDILLWKNNASSGTIGGGDYTSYTRLYYPTGTNIQSAFINGIPITIKTATSSATPLPYAELLDERPGLITLGVAHTTTMGGNSEITINSSQPISNTINSYTLSVYKQTGVEKLPFSFSITPPSTSGPIKTQTPGLVAKNGQITYNTTLQRDDLITVSFNPEDQ